MLQFIETICYENGIFHNLLLHEERMNRTRLHFFGLQNRLSLADALTAHAPGAFAAPVAGADFQSVSSPHPAGAAPDAGADFFDAGADFQSVPFPSVPDLQSATNPTSAQKLKCRLTYSETIQTIEFEPYTPKVIRSLQLIYDSTIDYGYKYKDRSALNALLSKRGVADEILIVKNGLITDTSYSNIVFLRKGKWYTPEAPLLPGTRRADYLHRKLIFPLDISPKDLSQFEEARLINAMLSLWEATPIAIERIYP